MNKADMDMIDFKSLEAELRDRLSRIDRWRRVVRALSVVVYLLVFAWLLFVLLGGMVLARLGWEDYDMLPRVIVPVFIGLVLLSFLLSYSLITFQNQECAAMRSVMQALFPQVSFSFSSEVDSGLLAGSRLFTASYGDPALGVDGYGEIELGYGNDRLHVADVGISYGWMNRWQAHPVLGYVVFVYRFVLRPVFAWRSESSVHNFRGMFGWCRTERRYEGDILVLPDYLEDKAGYLAGNIQALRKRFNARLVKLEDPEFEHRFVVYADSEVAARMVLTPAMMRRMSELRDAMGRDLMFSFSKGNFYYVASMPEGFLRLRPGRLQEGKMLERLYKDISMACRVADELRVNKLFADKA